MAADPYDKNLSIIQSLNNTYAIKAVGIVLSLLGYISSIIQFNPPIAMQVISGLLLGGYSLWHIYKRFTLIEPLTLPPPSKEFSPFANALEWEPWSRDLVTSELADLTIQNDAKHVLLVSSSGTGKTTMLHKLLPGKMPECTFRHISNYDNIIETILLRIADATPSKEAKKAVHEIVRYAGSKNVDASVVTLKLDEFLQRHIQQHNIVLCFDQVERYFMNFQDTSQTGYDKYFGEIDLIKAVLNSIQRCPSIRTVFAIRSEYVFGQLNNMFSFSPNGDDIENHIDFYFMWGVNTVDDKEVYVRILDYTNEIFGGTSIVKRIFSISKADDQVQANTFLLNMGGYLYEKLIDRAEYRKKLDAATTGDDFIDIYLDAAYEGYQSEHDDADRSAFDTVLLALASETKASGRACTLGRLSRLSHYPSLECTSIVSYLVGTGAIGRPERDDGEYAYRLKHDKLSERILKSDKLDVDARAIDGIRYLTDNRVPDERLTQPKHFPEFVEKEPQYAKNLSYISVYAFIAFGMGRVLFPEQVYYLFRGYYYYIFRLTGFGFQDYYLDPMFYTPVFIAQVFWISYIDRVNRGFLQNVGSSALRQYSNVLPLVGAIAGISFAYSPQLICAPLVAVTIFYVPVILIIGNGSQYSQQFGKMMRDWGWRTTLNVLTLIIVSLIISPFLDKDTPMEVVFPYVTPDYKLYAMLGLVVGQAAVLLWFWQHIRPEQNTKRIWSAMLAMHDKGRTSFN